MELFQLRYFLAACKSRNFSQAAALSFTSRQNLTHSIRALEKEFGVEFFRIVGNTPVLTVDGERAAEIASRVIESADELKSAFDCKIYKNTLPTLKVSCCLNMRYASDNVIKSLDGISDMRLLLDEQSSETCLHHVLDKTCDVALVYSMETNLENCTSLILGSAPLRILAAKESDLAKNSPVALHDLGNYDVLLLPDAQFMYSRFLKAFTRCGLDLDNIRSIADYSHMMKTIRSGHSVAVTSTFYPKKIPQDMVSLELSDVSLSWNLLLLYLRTTKKQELIKNLVNHILTHTVYQSQARIKLSIEICTSVQMTAFSLYIFPLHIIFAGANN